MTVDYTGGVRAIYDGATAAPRSLLTLHGTGNTICLNPAPPEMRFNLSDLDWFEDAAWRKDRINAVNLHFITAFLDRHVRGDPTRAAYLDVPVVDSDKGVWTEPPADYSALSPPTGGITVWKGFPRKHARGL